MNSDRDYERGVNSLWNNGYKLMRLSVENFAVLLGRYLRPSVTTIANIVKNCRRTVL